MTPEFSRELAARCNKGQLARARGYDRSQLMAEFEPYDSFDDDIPQRLLNRLKDPAKYYDLLVTK